MKAEIVALQSDLNLDTGVATTRLVLEVAGRKFSLQVEDGDDVRELLMGLAKRLNKNLQSLAPAPEEERQRTDHLFTQAEEVPASAPVVQEPEPQVAVVSWPELDESVLPLKFKKALGALDVAPVIELPKLIELVRTINAEFTIENWAEVGVIVEEAVEPTVDAAPDPEPLPMKVPPAPQPQPAAAAPAQPAAQVPGLTWANGTPMLPGAGKRARTVQKDEYGYPIVPQRGVVDPHEVVGRGDGVQDEDGVGQL